METGGDYKILKDKYKYKVGDNINMKFSKFLILFSLILLVLPATFAADVAFTVDIPIAGVTNTSNTVVVHWIPQTLAGTVMHPDINTVSCYADSGNTGFSTALKMKENISSDQNGFTLDVSSWAGRGWATYYVWCLNDENHDMNDYSPGRFGIVRYGAADIGPLAIDIPGGLMNGMVANMGAIASILVILIIVAVLLDLFTGVFGIVKFIMGVFGRR